MIDSYRLDTPGFLQTFPAIEISLRKQLQEEHFKLIARYRDKFSPCLGLLMLFFGSRSHQEIISPQESLLERLLKQHNET